MSAKSEKAKELFMQGYNCSQAVVGAFCEDLGLDFETAMKLSSSFGGGMGRLREVCGAVSGAFMVAGLKYGYADPRDKTAKTEHYKLIQDMAAKFKEENGSIICRELLEVGDEKETHVPEDRTKEYYKKRPCAQLVETAAKIAEEILNTK
ncbi:MAG: C_GCAxxG_C_C family protein [Clostridia bacterium]|nr:C_GCAxxG_C_C family protein [Clostridia bacterium]